MRYALPIGLFVVVVIFLAIGLERDPRYVPSPLIGKPLPAFELPVLDAGAPPLGRAQLAGRVFLLNVWASWCVSCREEHPVLNALAARGEVPVIGLNYKDERAAASAGWSSAGIPTRPACSTTMASWASISASTACPRPSSSTARASSATSTSVR